MSFHLFKKMKRETMKFLDLIPNKEFKSNQEARRKRRQIISTLYNMRELADNQAHKFPEDIRNDPKNQYWGMLK